MCDQLHHKLDRQHLLKIVATDNQDEKRRVADLGTHLNRKIMIYNYIDSKKSIYFAEYRHLLVLVVRFEPNSMMIYKQLFHRVEAIFLEFAETALNIVDQEMCDVHVQMYLVLLRDYPAEIVFHFEQFHLILCAFRYDSYYE